MNNPYMPRPYTLIATQKETEIDSTFVFEAKDRFVGGQFMQLSLPGVGEAPISISDFDTDTLTMTIRKVGRVTDRLFAMKPGETLYMRGPYGNGFKQAWFKDKDMVVIAGGTGLAPVKNTIDTFISNQAAIKGLQIIVGFKSPKDVLFKDTLRKWQEQVPIILTVDQEDDTWPYKVGLIPSHIKDLDLSDVENKTVILVGPPMMMKFTTLELLRLGFVEENIWVSFERKMSCGIGKCGHCKIDETYVCLEGPVFNYTKAKTLLD
ncbi:MAG: anaerobic sulfite reductase subunit AsrB [Vallitaleaceae bacterium]|nr:anaerobic sulfite reductase subunit AsrB [Vallitaleaceae bacterium]